MAVTKTQAIQTFLTNRAWPDLAAMYHPGMEAQVNVHNKEGGTRVHDTYQGKRWFGYQKNGETWKPFRIPFNASTDPSYDDTPLTWDFAKHVEAIGMTGWDWENRCSRWVAFDFDSIVGHADAHESKLSQDELSTIQQKATELPYVTVRKSTSGTGLHLYVVFEPPIPTQTHTEHAALGRAVLAKMSFDAGNFPFSQKVDIVGGNMWVWHLKQEPLEETEGLKLLHTGEPMTEAPKNWRTHTDVVAKRKHRAVAREYDDLEKQGTFEHMTEQRAPVELDEDHIALIKFLEKHDKWESYYNVEMQCLVTHTLALKEAHEKVPNMKGAFETTSSGSTEKNCFCYPCAKGGWLVLRFAQAAEHPTWERDANGWTKTYFNMLPTIRTASKLFGGTENSKGGYNFRTAIQVVKSLKEVGIEVTIPAVLERRKASLEQLTDGRQLFTIDGKGVIDDLDMPEWSVEGNAFTRIFPKPITESTNTYINDTFEEPPVRFLISEDRIEAGYVYCTPNTDHWSGYKKDSIKDALKNRGMSLNEAQDVLGYCANNPWTLVSIPFADEYPGKRMWNHKAPKYAVAINENPDKPRNFPHWTAILEHCGDNLTPTVLGDPWCQENLIKTGGEFLKIWCAMMFQRPTVRLPFLFFYSQNQSTGKSSFHEALGLLMDGGYVKAERTITANFNGELDRALLCVLEEVDLNKEAKAYDVIKDYVTARKISIRNLYQMQYMGANITHWVYVTNKLHYLPLEPGDERIIVSYVPNLADHELIPQAEMERLLMDEASDFLTDILLMELPDPPRTRLGLPVLSTPEKKRLIEHRETELETFLREECIYAPGEKLNTSVFMDTFTQFLSSESRGKWTPQRVTKEMPQEQYPKGRKGSGGFMYWGNLALRKEGKKYDMSKRPFVVNAKETLVEKDW